MATILPFIVRSRKPAETRAGDESAAIIIFPGVRYEAVGSDSEGDRSVPSGRVPGKRKGKSRHGRG